MDTSWIAITAQKTDQNVVIPESFWVFFCWLSESDDENLSTITAQNRTAIFSQGSYLYLDWKIIMRIIGR